jgi:proteasome lid subunit RPN8/RPN11
VSHHEVIGLLAGTIREINNKEITTRTGVTHEIHVLRAVPVRELDTGTTDVEMDPEHALEVTHEIAQAGLQTVGWYHSHPKFQPNPSLIDIVNQAQQQAVSATSI